MNSLVVWGIKLYELLTLVGLVSGPVVAVIITLWVDGRRRAREQRLTVLRMLISTRHLPADPAFQVAINLIPVEFSGDDAVMAAYREFLEAVAARLDGINDQAIILKTSTKIVRLVFEIARALSFSIRETDLQTSGYASDGWVKRDNLLLDSQKAMRDVASVMLLQSRLMAGATLTTEERKLLNLPDA